MYLHKSVHFYFIFIGLWLWIQKELVHILILMSPFPPPSSVSSELGFVRSEARSLSTLAPSVPGNTGYLALEKERVS